MVKRKYCFAVAIHFHVASDSLSGIYKERFLTYDDALTWARKFDADASTTIYFLYKGKYAFYCTRYPHKNNICYVSGYESTEWGNIETNIRFDHFKKEPEPFLKYARGILTPKQMAEAIIVKDPKNTEEGSF